MENEKDENKQNRGQVWPIKRLNSSYNIVRVTSSVTRKNCQMSIKIAQKWFYNKNDRFWHFYKNSLGMWEIWTN